jgi:hypothetical protein
VGKYGPSIEVLEREFAAAAGNRTIAIPDDPRAFARMVGIEPEAWQREILRSDHKQQIILAGRRTGKSTVAAILALHRALTIPGFRTIFTAPSLEQAQIPYLMAISMYRVLGRPVPAISERRTGLELVNGSTILAMAAVEKTRRGHGCDWLCVDEASRVDDPSYYGALLPSITRPLGYLTLMSTPFVRGGFFYETWHAAAPGDGGVDDWHRTFLTIYDSEYFQEHPELVEKVRRGVPEWHFEREYLCQFQNDEASVFSHSDIEEALRAGEDLQAIEFEEDTW